MDDNPEILCRPSYEEGKIEILFLNPSIREDKNLGTVVGLNLTVEAARQLSSHLGYWSVRIEDNEIETPECPYEE